MNRTNSTGNHGESDERDSDVQRVDGDDTFAVCSSPYRRSLHV